jgi:hypothetical protein
VLRAGLRGKESCRQLAADGLDQRWRPRAASVLEQRCRSGAVAVVSLAQARQLADLVTADPARHALLAADCSAVPLCQPLAQVAVDIGEVNEEQVAAGLAAAMTSRTASGAPLPPRVVPVQPAAAVDATATVSASNSASSSSKAATCKGVKAFRSVAVPDLDLLSYIQRLRTEFRCSSECYVICAAYLDRLDRQYPGITDALSCHRLLLCSLMLAIKFHDDTHYVNSFYARVGGLSLHEMNALEVVMMRLLDFRLHVTPEEFERYRGLLCQSAMQKNAIME